MRSRESAEYARASGVGGARLRRAGAVAGEEHA